MNGHPDAIMIPKALKEGDDIVARLKSVFSWTRLILGFKGKKNPSFRAVIPDKILISTNVWDTMLFPNSHPTRAGQSRYRWVKLIDHPRFEEYRAIVARFIPNLLIPDLLADVQIGELVEGADA